ncbi:MAG: hypothetical protein HC917_02735 [Richelia sp. SM2_1_7]|nr:hypothetical protein [Richelia sp. SM2_1_7]
MLINAKNLSRDNLELLKLDDNLSGIGIKPLKLEPVQAGSNFEQNYYDYRT